MNESERLAAELGKALRGEAWHGPSWQELIADLSRAEAHRRPLHGAHTIAEILAHNLTWLEVVARRLAGESPAVSDAEDWPAAPADEAAWAALKASFAAAGESLEAAVAAFPPGRLHEARPGMDGTWYRMISGELQHLLYHGGQVGLLRRAAAAATA